MSLGQELTRDEHAIGGQVIFKVDLDGGPQSVGVELGKRNIGHRVFGTLSGWCR